MAYFFRNGLHLLEPTSVAKTGASSTSTINTNGSVSFTLCTTISLNGVFSANYKNYMIVFGGAASTTDIPTFRLRSAGTDASGSNYRTQNLTAASTTVSGTRTAVSTSSWFGYTSTGKVGIICTIFNPFLSTPTTFRLYSGNARDSAYLHDDAMSHSLSSSYDGFTILTGTGTLDGRLCVYGIRT